MKTPVLAVLSFALTASAFASEGWLTNMAEAKAKAVAEKKGLLIDFTGSDWCTWCIRLRKEVFEDPEFIKEAPKKFVLVELDFPQDTSKQPEELRKQNAVLQQEFGVEGYPSIYLTDAEGRPYAKTGYQKGGAAEYIKHLDVLGETLRRRDVAFANAQKAAGLEKAKALQQGLETVPEELVASHYQATLSEIRALDPEDSLGVDSKFGGVVVLRDLSKRLQDRRGKGGPAVAEALRREADLCVGEHPKWSVRQKQKALMLVLNFLMPPKDNSVALKLVEDIRLLDPDTEEGKVAEQIRDRVVKMLEKAASK